MLWTSGFVIAFGGVFPNPPNSLLCKHNNASSDDVITLHSKVASFLLLHRLDGAKRNIIAFHPTLANIKVKKKSHKASWETNNQNLFIFVMSFSLFAIAE